MGADLLDLREIHSIGANTREWLISPVGCPTLKRLGIVLTGVSKANEGFRFVRPTPEWSQLLVTCSGVGRVLVDGAWRDVAPGDGYLTGPRALHAYHALPRRPWLVCWVVFSTKSPPVRPTVIPVDHRPLHDAILNLHRECLGRGDAAISVQWAELLHLLLRRAIAPAAGDGRLWRLWEVVDALPNHAWTLAQLAEEAGVGAEQLRRLCHRELGRSPMAQVTQLRMRRAAVLLATGQRVGVVAQAVGYDNPFAFSTAFRRVLGRPPSRHR